MYGIITISQALIVLYTLLYSLIHYIILSLTTTIQNRHYYPRVTDEETET